MIECMLFLIFHSFTYPRPWNFTETPWYKSGWWSHTCCQVLSFLLLFYYNISWMFYCLDIKPHHFWFLNNCRPMTQSGRPITGFVRPSTQSGRPGTMEQAIKTPRTASTARPVTSASGRCIRLGTVSNVTRNFFLFLLTERIQYTTVPKRNMYILVSCEMYLSAGLRCVCSYVQPDFFHRLQC